MRCQYSMQKIPLQDYPITAVVFEDDLETPKAVIMTKYLDAFEDETKRAWPWIALNRYLEEKAKTN